LSPRSTLRFLVGKLPPWLIILLCAGGFFVLTGGVTVGSGSITGYAEEQLHAVGPLDAGRVKAVPVRLGQVVKAGDVLAQLDSQVLELRRARLQAELDQAKAMIVSEQDQQRALLQRNQIQAVKIYADEKKSRAELKVLDQQVQRLEWLRARQLVRQSELEDARRRQHAVAAELSARPAGDQQALELAGQRPRPLSDQTGRLEERLAPFRAAVVVGEKALAEVEYNIRELTLRAPVDGTVGAILLRPGDAVAAGAPVVQVVVVRPGRVVAYVPERAVRNLSAGTEVRVRRVGVLASRMSGRVVEMSPMIEEFPPRARHSPAVPMWGRRVIIQLGEPAPLLPGEAFHVSPR
jgi:multidrug resistance efflux pump